MRCPAAFLMLAPSGEQAPDAVTQDAGGARAHGGALRRCSSECCRRQRPRHQSGREPSADQARGHAGLSPHPLGPRRAGATRVAAILASQSAQPSRPSRRSHPIARCAGAAGMHRIVAALPPSPRREAISDLTAQLVRSQRIPPGSNCRMHPGLIFQAFQIHQVRPSGSTASATRSQRHDHERGKSIKNVAID